MKVLCVGIGEKIAKLRINHTPRLTQEEFAKRIGISRAALSHYEKDRRDPDYETLQKIADHFEVSVDYLLGRSDTKKEDSSDSEFEAWLNDPRASKLYKEFNESDEERREMLFAMWEVIKSQKKK